MRDNRRSRAAAHQRCCDRENPQRGLSAGARLPRCAGVLPGQATMRSSNVSSGKSVSLTVLRADGNPRIMHARRVAGDERVPPIEVAPLLHEPVGAGRRQPGEAAHALRRELHAIRHEAAAVLVVLAAAALPVEQLAGDVGPGDLAGVDVFQLVQTAPPAPIAERFPLRMASSRRAISAARRGCRPSGDI